MRRTVSTFLGAEILIFGAAALAHGGSFGPGAAHHQAAIAEAVIAGVIVLGLGVALIWPGIARAAAIGVQAFALLGTLLGVVFIAVGIGPQSLGDVVVHALMLVVLVIGLVQVWRTQ